LSAPPNRSGSTPRKKATISDVASKAGVSIKTVSRVLNREPNVREATRKRVEQAMETLRYRPNSPGRMLAGNRTYILGLVYHENSSYVTRIQNGVLDACRAEHYNLLIHPCQYQRKAVLDEVADLVADGKVDGLLLTPPMSDLDNVRELMREQQIPHVTISRGAGDEASWAVGTNDREVCKAMTKYLISLGHRQLAFVRSHPDHKAMDSRYDGFLDAMRAASLAVRQAQVVRGENTFESGIDCGRQLLNGKSRPTAIFCANDIMAAGVMNAAHNIGLSIPADLSVAGFDDIPLASQVWPPLTTIRQPLRRMAKLAADLLIKRLRGETPDDTALCVEAEPIIRQSTGVAPGSLC
jgi:LacI family transcriptional regulator